MNFKYKITYQSEDNFIPRTDVNFFYYLDDAVKELKNLDDSCVYGEVFLEEVVL